MFWKSKKIEQNQANEERAKELNYARAYQYIIKLYVNNEELKQSIPVELSNGAVVYTNPQTTKIFNRYSNGGAKGEQDAELDIQKLRERFKSSEDSYNQGWNDCLDAIKKQMMKKIK